MINKERIRQKLANIANRNQSTAYWSPPKDGKATIRMFPYPHSEDPFLDYFFHFNIGRQSILCPVKNGLGSSCPICKLADEMYRSTNSQDKEISKRLYARQRFYGTVIDRADETLTGKYWGFSMSLYTKFLTWLSEEGGDYENFMDFDTGLDLVVSLEKTPGKMFVSPTAEPKRRESPLANTKEEIEMIMKSVKPASELFTVLTTQEIQQKLDEWLTTEGAPVDDGPSAESEVGIVKEKKKLNRVTKNVDDLFEEISGQI
jgi:hypothetical protein